MSEFFHHYGEILTDPAHLAVELTLMFVVDILVLGMMVPVIRRVINRRVHREHQAIDAEHGVDHETADELAQVAAMLSSPSKGGISPSLEKRQRALADLVRAEVARQIAATERANR